MSRHRPAITTTSRMAVAGLALLPLVAGAAIPRTGPTPQSGTVATTSRTTAAAGHGAPAGTSGRQLVDSRGRAVPWIADTAWWLTQRLSRDETLHYLDTRARQGFTVIQVPAVMGGGANSMGEVANAAGARPYRSGFGELEPADGPYWSHVRWLVEEANRRNLTVAVLPAWSRSHGGSTLTEWNGHGYGRFLAELLAGRDVVWMLGGDDPQIRLGAWRAVRGGIRSVDARAVTTYHPGGYRSSTRDFSDTTFATVQSGHCEPVVRGHAPLLGEALGHTRRPVVDAEPLYEDHPWCWDASRGYSTPQQVRSHLWWAALDSSAGVTYGHHTVWQMIGGANATPVNAPRGDWRSALEAPVATQIRHLRSIFTARPLLGRVGDPSVVSGGQRGGWDHVSAARGADGRYVMAYVPTRRAISLDGSRLAAGAGRATVTWMNPRDGSVHAGGTRAREDLRDLTPPADGDWVLVVDAPGVTPSPPTTAR